MSFARWSSFFLLLVAALAVPWDAVNAPSNADSSGVFQYMLSKLPLAVSVTPFPWSDTYWPSQQSGIASRWQRKHQNDFKYHLYTLNELKALSRV